MNWTDRIVATSDVCHGKPRIRGTRIMVSVILDNLADGMDVKSILEVYLSLSHENVHAAELARDRFVPIQTIETEKV